MGRKRLGKKQIGILLVFVLSANYITACSERTVDYRVDGSTENTESGKRRKGVQQFADLSEWQEAWEAVNTKGNTVKLQAVAQIILPDVEQMSVITVEEPEMNPDFKRRVAESIFKTGAIYYYDEEHALNENRVNLREDSQSKYEIDEYLGEYEGIPYTLRFSSVENGEFKGAGIGISCGCRENWITLSRTDTRACAPEEFADVKDEVPISLRAAWGPYIEEENQCELSKEEARQVVERFVEALGLEYPVYADSVPLIWEVGQGREVMDGYVFTYDAGIDDVSFVACGTQQWYENFSKKKESEQEQYDMNARITVRVNGKGIIDAQVENPIEVSGVFANVEFLAFDNVCNVIKENVKEHFGDFRFEYTSEDRLVTFSEMELLYFRVRDKEREGSYSYVPAWRLANVYWSSVGGAPFVQTISNPVIINAIDGSVINFYEEA